MAVIAIIAILAAVLVPTVTGYINRSKKTAIVSQVRNVITAVETHNATATGNDIIGAGVTVKALVGEGSTTTSVKIESDLLTKDGINRLNDMTVGVAQKINQDSNAVKNITLKDDGTFESFKESANSTIGADGKPFTPATDKEEDKEEQPTK